MEADAVNKEKRGGVMKKRSTKLPTLRMNCEEGYSEVARTLLMLLRMCEVQAPYLTCVAQAKVIKRELVRQRGKLYHPPKGQEW